MSSSSGVSSYTQSGTQSGFDGGFTSASEKDVASPDWRAQVRKPKRRSRSPGGTSSRSGTEGSWFASGREEDHEVTNTFADSLGGDDSRSFTESESYESSYLSGSESSYGSESDASWSPGDESQATRDRRFRDDDGAFSDSDFSAGTSDSDCDSELSASERMQRRRRRQQKFRLRRAQRAALGTLETLDPVLFEAAEVQRRIRDALTTHVDSDTMGSEFSGRHSARYSSHFSERSRASHSFGGGQEDDSFDESEFPGSQSSDKRSFSDDSAPPCGRRNDRCRDTLQDVDPADLALAIASAKRCARQDRKDLSESDGSRSGDGGKFSAAFGDLAGWAQEPGSRRNSRASTSSSVPAKADAGP